MPATIYPVELPGPSKWEITPFERRAVRGIREPADAARARSRDRNMMAKGEWLYIPALMTIWVAWYEDVLKYGQFWFTATLPGEGGFVSRVVRYAGPVERTYIAVGVYSITSSMEIRGHSLPPQA